MVWFVGFRDGVVISIFSLIGTVVSAEGVEKMPKETQNKVRSVGLE